MVVMAKLQKECDELFYDGKNPKRNEYNKKGAREGGGSNPPGSTAIFIRRDTELASIGGLPVGVKDVWVEMGYKKEYTLDLQRISNL